MPYCKKCGELGRSDKCKKCGSALHTSPSSLSHYFNADHWQSRATEKKSSFISSAGVKTSVPKKIHELRKIPTTIFEKKHRIVPIPSYPASSSTNSTSSQSQQSSSPLSPSTSSKQSCTYCHQQLSGKLIQLADDDEHKKYHWSCLLCFDCHQPFQSTNIYLNTRRQTYHPKCLPNSPILDRSCSHCKGPVLDKYLCIHTTVVHPECFRCTGCQEILKSASIYCHKDQDQVFCRPCHHKHFPQDQYTITNEAHWKIVPQPRQQFVKAISQESYHDASPPPTILSSPSVTQTLSPQVPSASINSARQALALPNINQPNPVHPSELMRAKNLGHNRRTLPRFGAIKVCPGCRSRIASVHEECTGPRAAKWHRQCLVCSSCHKFLDSSAKIHQTPGNDLVPTCTTCLLKRKNVHQKNNNDFMKEWKT